MSRLVKKSPSVCTDLPLDNADIYNKLSLLRQLLASCFGPTGRLKQVHNNIGGHVVTTSTSSVLFPAISSSQPLVNLIKTSIHNHVSRFSDCGLFAAGLCLSLIEHAQQSGLAANVSIRINKHLLGLCVSYLQREDCGCKVKLDFCSSQSLITLARSVISSKPACVLTEQEMLHISRLAVQAFLLTLPCNNPGIVMLGKTVSAYVEGHPVLNSAVFPGLLLDVTGDFCLNKEDNLNPSPLSVVVFSTSLAGDLCELGEGLIEVPAGVDSDLQILEQLLELGKQVVTDEVKLFACQKVIHPVLQQYLRSEGVIVIERLGAYLMEPLIQLTGAQPVATLHTSLPAKAYGEVSEISVRQFGSKTLLHLRPSGESAICTMVLCHRNETMLSELKVVCQKTEHVLRLTIRDPAALLGGGCTETHLAAYIRHKSNEVSEPAAVLGCSHSEYHLCMEGFCCSLESVAKALEHSGGNSLIDLTHAHHWTLPADMTKGDIEDSLGFCGCGLVGSSPSRKWTYINTKYTAFSPASLSVDPAVRPRVLDSFTAKLNALQVAVETANLALDVRYIIQDVN
ncbi:usick-Kaufman Bardet-Biedl syndromes chaperonin [Solea senegalensis]|uniref:Usick-Kaufman Bardet-Biedl syndromes chaperonin n=1 Tax=Solea senegalensis TaxID=28829 RepID=A0AAV6S6R7_SOLSE|nr:McKusick-Kaufman/Bardet-Biedl syndromes putative chaperonin [Solea senegalensis]KAG7512857.1 usick-Kaufman Bardet-Biedl syndromes chaperonin [Solea senegalensis]